MPAVLAKPNHLVRLANKQFNHLASRPPSVRRDYVVNVEWVAHNAGAVDNSDIADLEYSSNHCRGQSPGIAQNW